MFDFEYIRPDEVAECWNGVDADLYGKLWALVEHYPTDTSQYETPPEPGTNCLANLWDRLSEADQEKLNALAVRRNAELQAMLEGIRK